MYTYFNDTAPSAARGQCLVLALTWSVGAATLPPAFDCDARVLALEYDCHTLWGVTSECSYDAALDQVTAVWSVVNLGPDSNPPLPGGGAVARVPPVVRVRRVGAGPIIVSA